MELTSNQSMLNTSSLKNVAADLMICEEVLLDQDGTALWRSSATAACSSNLSLSLQHEVIFQKKTAWNQKISKHMIK